ncbi:MAG: HDOD domain-containing protein [bacterium]|nr:HDOD domain-containing protein [bacterium]
MIDEIIKKIEFFPAFPASMSKALKVVNSPDAGTDKVLEAIRYDVAITTNLLKLCNSPLFSFRREISSVREAIVYAGMGEIKKLILMLASKQVFSAQSPGYESRQGEMLKQSIAAAVISDGLTPFAPPLQTDLFTTCLMLDVGKIVLSEYIGKSFDEMLQLMEEAECDFVEAEKKIIGITHAEVGARVLEHWNFPAEMITAVRFHHDPHQSPELPLTHFASLASTIAMISGFATSMDGLAYKGFPDLCKRYHLKNKDISLILADSLERIENVLEQIKQSDTKA